MKRDKWAVTRGLCAKVVRQCHCWQGYFLAHLLLKSRNFGISVVYCVLVVSEEKILVADISMLHSFGSTPCSFVVNMLTSQRRLPVWRDGGMFAII